MKREVVVAFAVIASLLVVAAQPAAASHSGGVVVSVNDTDTDFAAAEMTNMSVVGSGSSATVEFDNRDVIDDVEDGDISEYSGSTSGFSAQQDVVLQGAWSIEGSFTDSSGAIVSTSGLPTYPEAGDNITVTLRAETTDTRAGFRYGVQDSSNHYGVAISPSANELEILKDGAVQSSPTGSFSLGTAYEVTIEWGSGGSITISVTDDSSSTVSGTLSDSDYTDGGIGWVASRESAISPEMYGDFAFVGERKTSGEYLNNHSATNTVSGFANVTDLNNVSLTATWRGDSNGDGTFDTLLNQTTGITTAANHTFTWSEFEGDTVRANLTVESTGTNESFVLESEGVEAVGVAPTIDNSSASPTGELTTSSPTFEIDVNDSDFPDEQGDTVIAELFIDGSSAGTDTLAANGTASVTTTVSGGSHTYNWTVTDSYGHSVTSQDFTVTTPGNLTIRRETNASQLVDDVQVNITAYHSGNVTRRSSTNGNVSLEGLPLDEPIIVRAQADGYYSRTAVIEDVFEQQSMFLLNDSVAAYQIRFDLQDPTGDYPRADTVLFVERDINLSGNVEWRVIAGDNFGIQGVPVDLAQEERYRIRIKNLETGTAATLGSFTAIQDETVTLQPASPVFDFSDIERDFTWKARENESAQKIVVEYAEENTSKTADVKITIRERFNTSNVLVDNQSFTDVSSVVFEQPLTNDEVNKTWSLVLYVDRGGGYVRYGPEPIGGGPRDLIPSELDAVWRTSVGVAILLISSMAFSELNRGVGAIATSLTGGILWFVGLLSSVAIGPAVVVAIAISIAYRYRTGATT